MKKKVVSVLLCLCMLVGLLPSGVLATESDSTLQIQYGNTIPTDFAGMVLSLEKKDVNGTTVYAVNIGAYNAPSSNAFTVQLKYDSDVLVRSTASGGNVMAWTSAIADANYQAAMLADPSNDEFGLLSASITNAETGIFERRGMQGPGGTTEYSVSYSLKQGITEMVPYFNGVSDDGLGYAPKTNTLVNFGTVYFKLKVGKTETDFTSESLTLYPGTNVELDAGAATIKNGKALSKGAFFLNFPEPPESTYDTTFTVTAGGSPVSGAVLGLTGTSDKGTNISNLFTEAERTTNSSGQITLKLPAGSSYTWSTEKTVGGKSYSGTQSFSVTASGTNAIACALTEATDKFPVYIKAQDLNQNAVDLTGATLKYGVVGNFNPVTAENITDGMVKFDVPTDGSKPLLLSGVTGDYQNIIEDEVSIKMTKTSATAASFQVEKGSDIAQIKNDGSRNYILLTLKPTVTNVKLPVPVPDNITEDDAKNLTLTFTSPNGGTPVVVDKTSGGLNVETVDGKVTVTADAPLQDGTYTMTIGGSGFDPVTTPVTVLRKTEANGELTSIVNVGGTVTEDGSGNISTVGGGITGVKQNSADAKGNGSANLTGDPNDSTVITKGGSITNTGNDITVPDADNDPNVDPLPGGILADPDISSDLTPEVMKGPIYDIKSKLTTYSSSGAYQRLEVEVYLKNAVAGSGTFGMRFDKNLFDAPSSSDLTINDALGLQFLNGTPAYMVQDVASDYIYFYWSMKDTYGNTELDATSEPKLIATINLTFKAGIGQADLHNNMITALNFPESQAGQDVIATSEAEFLMEALAGYWRQKDFDEGSFNFNQASKLDPDKAIGDGFYQIFHTEGDTSAESYDIRMQFNLPDEVENDSVQFWVRESEDQIGQGIENAEILIYDASGALVTTDPLVTDRNGRAHLILPAGTYSYSITEESHWDYPDGTANNPGYTKDTFTLGQDGAITMTPLDTDKITPVFDTTIYPFMAPKTIHYVTVTDLANETAPMNISLGSRNVAYNNVTYYFTLQPAAGYTWAKSMADVANALSAVLYETDKNGQTETAAFHTQLGTLTPNSGALVKWDAMKQQFYLDADITGAAFGANSLGFEVLRAGDLKITVDDPASLVKATEYQITASAGAGGKVSYVMAGNPNPSTILETDNTTPATASQDYTGPATLNETLGQGESKSATYTFTPETGGSIHKVIINGVVQPLDEEAAKSPYVYQFRNVTGSQSIYVEFEAANGSLSDANLTVASGEHGSVTVDQSGTPAPVGPVGTIEGPGTGTYTLPAGLTNVGLTITPETGYKIDKVYLVKNGEKSDVTGTLTQNTAANPTTQTGAIMDLTLSGADLAALVQQGANSTVIATFMPYEATASTQAVVTATVVKGLGSMMPAGVSVYPIGATPLYQLQPKDTDWEIDTTPNSGAVLVTKDTADAAPVDYSSDATAPSTPGGSYSYTMPALTGDTLLDISFSEKTYKVKGQIQTVFNVLLATDRNIAPAKITFTRDAVPGVCAAYSFSVDSGTLAVSSSTNSLYGLLDFTAKVPKGDWTVTVHKQGYLDYIISEFSVDDTVLVADGTGEMAIYFGSQTTDMKPVVLTPGDAVGDGKSIAVNDAAIVVAGWLTGATSQNRLKGDIDESSYPASGSSTSGDMGYVMSNLNRVRTRQTYNNFCSAGGTGGTN